MKILTVHVKPNIPENLRPLEELAHNLWISWHFEAINLFISLDYDKWLLSQQNPVKMLGLVAQDVFEQKSRDDSFLNTLNIVYDKFKNYLSGSRWFGDPREKECIAYFSMEYGLDISLPVYSGGLGILSGDHLKSASDMGLPLIGVGLLYRQGYFKQYLNPDGFQQELYPENDWYNLPVTIALDKENNPFYISVPIGGSVIVSKIWLVNVGRTKLYLMDTNIPENSPENRIITDALYGGDREMRIRQEILLGIGGITLLQTLGYGPCVVHMNEGHSAFLSLERIRVLMKNENLSFWEAVEATKPTTIFTTHTPVPAGNERFEIPLMKKYFFAYSEELGLSWEDFLALGREDPKNTNETFCLTILALKVSSYANGVSRLHGEISRSMWKNIYPELPEEEVPINHVTNGIHPKTWLSHDLSDLFDRYLGPKIESEPANFEIWDRIDRISDEELWRTHDRRRERLVVFARHRLKYQLARRGMMGAEQEAASNALSPYTLTICFARRFATYKRGTLLLNDPERLIKLLSDSQRPIQLIFAGKAHPNDLAGKEMIKHIIHFGRDPKVRSRIVFLEDYDMTIAKYMVAGSDIWLNTPRRPLEASGTSGMKAAINGSLNVSVLDGWWDEGYTPESGWAIGSGEVYDRIEEQDDIEGKALYDLLEEEIIPLFYTRGRDGLPRDWIARMRSSIKNVGKNFGSHRMLMEYTNNYYKKAIKNSKTFKDNDFALAKEVASFISDMKSAWHDVRIELDKLLEGENFLSGQPKTINARVFLGEIKPEQVSVQLYYGSLSSKGEITNAEWEELKVVREVGDHWLYSAKWTLKQSGRQGYSVRILPKHPGLVNPYLPGFIKWAELL